MALQSVGRLLGGPYDQDRAPVVTVEIGPVSTFVSNGVTISNTGLREFKNIKEYCYDTDVLSLGDPFSVRLSNIDGDYSGKIAIGDTAKFYVSDPDVSGGAKNLKVTGIVTSLDMTDDMSSGSQIQVTGADLGWHLVNNTGPLFHRYRGKSINAILQDVIDPSWNLQGVQQGNDFNRKAKLGRSGLRPLTQGAFAVLPPIQFEPGQAISDVLIPLARRQKYLLNVSADGYLQFFQPNYNQDSKYTFHHHKATEKSRTKNNVKTVRLRQSIEGQYTKVTCVGQVAYLQFAQASPGNPNAGRIRSDFVNTSVLPFTRNWSFGDSDQMDTTAVSNRAQWKWQRGQFDSWTYEITVKGHSMDGNYFEPDTICTIDDTVFGIQGQYYVGACQYRRTVAGGTETMLRIHRKGVLGA